VPSPASLRRLFVFWLSYAAAGSLIDSLNVPDGKKGRILCAAFDHVNRGYAAVPD